VNLEGKVFRFNQAITPFLVAFMVSTPMPKGQYALILIWAIVDSGNCLVNPRSHLKKRESTGIPPHFIILCLLRSDKNVKYFQLYKPVSALDNSPYSSGVATILLFISSIVKQYRAVYCVFTEGASSLQWDSIMKTKLDPIVVLVGGRIRQIRKAQKISQQELGERADLNYKYIGGVERGERNPSIQSLVKIARGLKVEVGDLFRLEGQRQLPDKDR
jgi:DNA-binding XRE family transcriptional regulator